MAFLLLILFIGVPIAEIAVFIQAGQMFGLWPTLAAVILTAVAGVWLLRLQGLATLTRAHANLDQGVLPLAEAFDGICLVLAGALLLTPGFLTDAVGFALLVPPVRTALRHAVWQYARRSERFHVHTRTWHMREEGDDTIIEGEFHEVDPRRERDRRRGRDDDEPPPRIPPGER